MRSGVIREMKPGGGFGIAAPGTEVEEAQQGWKESFDRLTDYLASLWVGEGPMSFISTGV